MTMDYRALAGNLVQLLPAEAAVAIIDGGQAGYWAEVECAGIVAMAWDANGPWEVGLYARSPAVARAYCHDPLGVFEHEAAERPVYWFRTAEDGPDGAEATPLAVAHFIRRALLDLD